jgi:hypothetical protein
VVDYQLNSNQPRTAPSPRYRLLDLISVCRETKLASNCGREIMRAATSENSGCKWYPQ